MVAPPLLVRDDGRMRPHESPSRLVPILRAMGELAVHVLLAVAVILPCPVEASAAQEDGPPSLVLLADTGEMRDGLPVFRARQDGGAAAEALGRGFATTMLRLYALEQVYLQRHEGNEREPAYLLLSDNEGGFARFGFWLGDTAKPEVGYVDLNRGHTPTGRFGAMDQMFPHELGHVVLQHLVGAPRPGGSNQIHAIGVRTDPSYAFNEGFAEHFQVVAAEDPGAWPPTAALAADTALENRAAASLAAYRREMTALWAPLTRMRSTFPLWYSGTEQILRYHAVRDNAFAHRPSLPGRLLAGPDPYAAYLLESLLPGPRSVRCLLVGEPSPGHTG